MGYNLQHLLSTVLRNRAVALPPANKFAGAWGIRPPWLDGSTVLDQRTGLGTPRLPEPRRCLEFNGTNQYGWIPIDPVTEFPFTIFGWARKSDTTLETIFGIGASSASTKLFVVQADEGDRVAVSRRNPTTITTETTITAKVNTWSAFVVSFTSSTSCQVFRDGELVADLSGLTSVNVDSSFNRFVFGATNTVSPEGYWTGQSMHCGFLRRAATLADAQAFHTTGIIPDAEVLLPLDDNSTTVAHNIGSSAAQWLDEPRRNLLTYTKTLNASPWINMTGGVGLNTVVSVQTAPDDTQTAWRIDCDRVGDTINDRSEITCSFPTAVTVGAQATGSFWVKAATPSDVGKQFAWRHVGSTAYGSFTLTADWVRVTRTETSAGLGNNWSFGSRGTFNADAQVSFVVWQPQLELGPTATDYQPVLGSGIDYPEATLVNGTSGMLYEGRDVPFSRQNDVGYSERRNLLRYTEDTTGTGWAFFNVSGGASQIGNNFVFGASPIDRIMSTQVTIEANTVMSASFTLSGSGSVRVFLTDGAGSTYSPGNITLSPTPTRYSISTTLLNAGSSCRCAVYNDSSGNEATFTIHNAQMEFGSVATPYQRIDSDPGTDALFPALLSDPTKSAATDPLTYTGKAHFDGALEQSNCLTFDGVDDYIAMDLSDVAGPEIYTSPPNFSEASWAIIGSGISKSGQTITRTTNNGGVVRSGISIGKVHFVRISYSKTNGTSVFGVGDGTGTIYHSSTEETGVLEGCFVAASTSLYLRIGDAADAVTVNSISVRELPTTVGPELVTNGGFDADTDWTKGTGWTISGGSANAAASNFVLSQNSLFTSGTAYRITFSQTFTSGSLQVRIAGTQSLGFFNSSGTHVINFVATATGALEFNGTALTTSIDNVSVVQTGLIPHDGTSILTYRPEGDGINGTAGTAFNIQLGDVEHIPCSEGAGDEVHGTKLNQAYQIVNGQASNWETKQDDYHYNITEGAGRVDISEETDEQKVEDLFAASEQGAVYDPSDFSTMFQDIAGTTPVTENGQTVALHLDKSKGLVLGPELVTNGTFDSNLTGWNIGSNITAVWDNGEADVALTGAVSSTSSNWFSSGVVVETGDARLFSVEFDATWVSGGSLQVGTAYVPSRTIAPNGGVKTRYTAICGLYGGFGLTVTPSSVSFGSIGGSARWKIDNVTCKEIPGNHRYQTVAASEPTKGRHPVSGVRQLLTYSEDFTNAVWSKSGSSVSGSYLLDTAANAPHFISVGPSTSTGQTEVFTVWARPGTLNWMGLFVDGVSAFFNLQTGSIGTVVAGMSATMAIESDGFYRCSITRVRVNSVTTARIYVSNADNTFSYFGDGTGSIELQKSQFELTSRTNYQKSTTRFDITEEGQDDVHYLWYDGIDDFMETNEVDFTGTDKMTVWWGGRKLSDAAFGILLELTTNGQNTNGGLICSYPSATTVPDYFFGSRGTLFAGADTPNDFVAPVSNVICNTSDISAPFVRMRVNGQQVAENTATQGTGNYANAKIYFGRRAGASIPANINEYMTIIRGAESDIFTIQEIENVVARKVGLDEFHYEGNLYIPASQTNPGFDALGNPLTHPAVVGINAAETEVDFSPVDNSWPEQYSIPGADLPNYTFDGDPGDIEVRVNTPTREGSFRLEK